MISDIRIKIESTHRNANIVNIVNEINKISGFSEKRVQESKTTEK